MPPYLQYWGIMQGLMHTAAGMSTSTHKKKKLTFFRIFNHFDRHVKKGLFSYPSKYWGTSDPAPSLPCPVDLGGKSRPGLNTVEVTPPPPGGYLLEAQGRKPPKGHGLILHSFVHVVLRERTGQIKHRWAASRSWHHRQHGHTFKRRKQSCVDGEIFITLGFPIIIAVIIELGNTKFIPTDVVSLKNKRERTLIDFWGFVNSQRWMPLSTILQTSPRSDVSSIFMNRWRGGNASQLTGNLSQRSVHSRELRKPDWWKHSKRDNREKYIFKIFPSFSLLKTQKQKKAYQPYVQTHYPRSNHAGIFFNQGR